MSDQYENSGTPAVRPGIRRVTPDAFQLVRAGEAMTDLRLAVSDQWDKMVKLDANLTDGQSCPCRAAVETACDREIGWELEDGGVPPGVDVPDDYEAGVHDAAMRIRAALEHDCPKNMNVHAWQAIAEAVGELEQALEKLGGS